MFIVVALLLVGRATRSQQGVPRTWDEHELHRFEVPLVHAEASPKHAAPDYYYRIPVRPIYKSYPIYAPGHEPPDYLAWLERPGAGSGLRCFQTADQMRNG